MIISFFYIFPPRNFRSVALSHEWVLGALPQWKQSGIYTCFFFVHCFFSLVYFVFIFHFQCNTFFSTFNSMCILILCLRFSLFFFFFFFALFQIAEIFYFKFRIYTVVVCYCFLSFFTLIFRKIETITNYDDFFLSLFLSLGLITHIK